MKKEQLAKEAMKEILLKQIPDKDRVKWKDKRPTKKQEDTEWRVVKKPA